MRASPKLGAPPLATTLGGPPYFDNALSPRALIYNKIT